MTTNQEKLAPPTLEQLDSANRETSFQLPSWLPQKWQVWAAILILFSGGIGFTATSVLLKLPKAPNCPSIFWPIASASMRLYCAQLEAETGTVDSLLKAINLVEGLPEDHPLRLEINRNIEQWAQEILNLAEKDFQAGKLEEAIATARKIPTKVQAYQLVEKRISRWQSIWTEGEEIFAKVEEQLRDSQWNQAFRTAVQLLNLDNKYWATTKYDETVKKIQLAREESSKLDGAYAILRRGGLENWLKAIAEAKQITSESYAYQEAQNLIQEAKDKLLEYVQNLIDNSNWSKLADVADRFPESLGLSEEVSDWKAIASAGLDAQSGTVEGLQTAITAAQQIAESRPLYQQAQDLINRWKLETEDVTHLAKARDLAQPGTINDLNAAISEAQIIPSSNPRYREAQREIRSWTRQIQTIEDRPFLERAREVAQNGTVNALQEAITQASSINSDRALYREAQQEIGKWRTSIERQEDQPFLDQALSLGNVKEYRAAIDAAQQIRRGRVLYPEARKYIRRWRGEIQAAQDWQEALQIAEARTPEALISAISIVRKIPASSDVGSQSTQALNRWSYQLLGIASERANVSSLTEAIRLAKMIPRESAAYSSARSQIELWQKQLQPTPVSASSPSGDF